MTDLNGYQNWHIDGFPLAPFLSDDIFTTTKDIFAGTLMILLMVYAWDMTPCRLVYICIRFLGASFI
jgi:hypothetical protein